MKFKVGIIIQARLGSLRLPGKVLKLIGTKPLLQFLLERLKMVKVPIYVATTIKPEDDLIINLVKDLDCNVFRGSENNVLERFYECAIDNKLDIIVRLTADNPLLEGDFVQNYINKFIELYDENLYMSTGLSKTFPIGISVEIFTIHLLTLAYNNAKLDKEKEHVTPFIKHYEETKLMPIFCKNNKSHYRLTVDTMEDLKLIQVLSNDYKVDNKTVSEIIDILDRNPELLSINANIKQKLWNE